jgi:asparagine synthase (glutamine-hydrolysing)
MSGICAIWRSENPPQIAEILNSVGRGLSLRASERVEQTVSRNAGVGVSAAFGTQQIYQDNRVLVACDADLINEADLQKTYGDLAEAAANPAALLARLYDKLGEGFVEKLNGGFAVVLWDRQQETLLAAVDPIGINRLVYFETGHIFLVASRIDALLQSGVIASEVNPRAIANFLNFGVNLAPETIFRKVRRLAPGTLLVTAQGETRISRYWDMRYGVGRESHRDRLCGGLKSVVETAVATHCKNEDFDQLGAYLSGGTDSSTVVGMMSRLGRGPVQAFSIGFEEQQFNELRYAGIAASNFRANHHTYLVSAQDCFNALPRMVRHFDEPFGNSSAIPTYFCARLAAENGIRILLAGDGGDELFGGNERYRVDKIFEAYQAVPSMLRKGLIEPALHRLPVENGIVGRVRRYVRRSNLPPPERFFSYNLLCAKQPQEVFDKDFLTELGAYSVLELPSRYYREADARDHLDRLLYVDVKITLGDSDLPKVTQMSELAGIQTRFPFLDRAVVEFSGSIPARLKVKGLEKRYLFKRAFRRLLPIDIIRKTKHGFGIPVATWLKSDRRLREFSRDILFSTRAQNRGYFRRAFLEDLISKHEADESTYYGDTLWSFFVLELWHRQVVDQPVGGAQ